MNELQEMKIKAEKVIEENKGKMVDLGSEIHENPELSYEEYNSQQLLVEELESQGFSVETGIAGLDTSFRAIYEGSKAEPIICLMVEYDALEDLGHACGHNLSGV